MQSFDESGNIWRYMYFHVSDKKGKLPGTYPLGKTGVCEY